MKKLTSALLAGLLLSSVAVVAMSNTASAASSNANNTSSIALPNRLALAAQVNGRNVTRVNVQTGYYRALGGGMWGEFDLNDKRVFTFKETQRDDWSVYLVDESRNVTLQLDIFRKKVSYGDSQKPKSDLYDITSAQSVTGRNVKFVNVGSGYYKALDNGMWGEFNKNHKRVFTFKETQRDDWSVYLVDESRNVTLQLDVFRKKVVYGDSQKPKSDLYDVGSFQ